MGALSDLLVEININLPPLLIPRRLTLEWAVIHVIDEDIAPPLREGDMGAARRAVDDLAREIAENDIPEWAVEGCDPLDPTLLAVLIECEDLIRSGMAEEAIHRLRLLTKPKWRDVPSCVAGYAQAMGEVYGPPIYPSPCSPRSPHENHHGAGCARPCA